MNKGIALTGWLLLSCVVGMNAQQKVELRTPKQQADVRLYDEDNNFLLTLPMTFSMTTQNILVVMLGNDKRLADEQSVWMFSEEMNLADFMRINRNVGATKSFKKQHAELNSLLTSQRKIKIHRKFDEGYEVILKNAKPVFLKIDETASGQFSFYLQFYVATSNEKYPYVLTAKCKPVEIKMNY